MLRYLAVVQVAFPRFAREDVRSAAYRYRKGDVVVVPRRAPTATRCSARIWSRSTDPRGDVASGLRLRRAPLHRRGTGPHGAARRVSGTGAPLPEDAPRPPRTSSSARCPSSTAWIACRYASSLDRVGVERVQGRPQVGCHRRGDAGRDGAGVRRHHRLREAQPGRLGEPARTPVTRRTSPARPTSPSTTMSGGNATSRAADATASRTARSAAGSWIRMPPTVAANTS